MAVDLGASVAIIQEGRILLTQRADLEVWTLPGGGVEAGESVAEAAIREAREETGLEVELIRLVGIYMIPSWGGIDHHGVLFAGRPVGGTLRPQPEEVIAEGFFDPQSLPQPLVWWQRQRIRDALEGVSGVVWVQKPHWPFEAKTRRDLYELIDRSGLPRQAFFMKYFSRPEPEPPDLQVRLLGGVRPVSD